MRSEHLTVLVSGFCLITADAVFPVAGGIRIS